MISPVGHDNGGSGLYSESGCHKASLFILVPGKVPRSSSPVPCPFCENIFIQIYQESNKSRHDIQLLYKVRFSNLLVETQISGHFEAADVNPGAHAGVLNKTRTLRVNGHFTSNTESKSRPCNSPG